MLRARSTAQMGTVIQLPWPPTVNHYYTVVRGRKILSTKGRAYKKYCCQCMLIQRIPKLSTDDAPFSLDILASPPDRRKRDLDNLLKPIIDSLVDYGAIPDDSYVDIIRIERMKVIKEGQIEVDIL